MARPLRIERVGGWFHVTARGNERRDIFRDDRDRRRFLELLEEAVSMFATRLHAYVLMSNHYHLLIELTEPNLSRAIHWLNVSYTVWFNRRHGRSGHLLRGRFKSLLVEQRAWGLEISRYVHLNPVRSGLGPRKKGLQRRRPAGAGKVNTERVRERIGRLRRYPWSSYRAYIGSVKKPAWLTTEAVLKLGGRGASPAEQYRKYCEEAVRRGLAESPWENVIGQAVLGSEQFAARVAAELERDNLARKKPGKRPRMAEVIAAVERVRGEKWKEFRDRYGDEGRDLVLYLGRKVSGMSIRELSQRAGIQYMSAATAVRRFSKRAAQERKIAGLVKAAMAQIEK